MGSPNSFAAQLTEMGKAMLVAGLSLLAAAAVLLFSAENELRRNNAEVERTNAALLELAEIKFLVVGVDYSARGYSLTGEKLFFDHEAEKQRDLKAGMMRLKSLLRPEQQEQAGKLARLIAVHAKVYGDFVAQGPLRTREMAALITDPVERKKRYDALDALAILQNELMADLVRYQAQAVEQQRFSLILTFLIVAIAFFGTIMEAIVKRIGHRKSAAIAAGRV